MDRQSQYCFRGCPGRPNWLVVTVLFGVLSVVGCAESGGGGNSTGGGEETTSFVTVSGDSDTWISQSFTAMPTARHAFALVEVDCVLYAIGGNVDRTAIATVEAFDPTADGGLGAWSSKTDMTTPRFSFTAAVVDGIIYAIGGRNGTTLTTVEAFDPAGNSGAGSWSTKTNMPTARRSLTSAVAGGVIYAIGGVGGTTTVEAFDPTGNSGAGSWSTKTVMPAGRDELTAQTVNGIVYAIGGQAGCTGVASVEAFDPDGGGGTGSWSTMTDMLTARKGLSSALVNGIVYAVGGITDCDGGTLLKTVEAFDPDGGGGTGLWSSMADMPTTRQSLSSVAVNGIVFAIGGNAGTGSSTPLDTVEAYAP